MPDRPGLPYTSEEVEEQYLNNTQYLMLGFFTLSQFARLSTASSGSQHLLQFLATPLMVYNNQFLLGNGSLTTENLNRSGAWANPSYRVSLSNF